MTAAELIHRRIETAGQRELSRLYFAALTAQAKGEPAAARWEQFGRIFARVLTLCHLAGRMDTVNRLRFKVPNGEAFKVGELATYAEPDGILTGPFIDALNWFVGKVPNLRSVVDQMLPAARKRAFWVTGVEQVEALEKIKARLAKPLAAEFETMDMSDFIHSEAEITGLTEARLETVYRTNTQGALAEGAMSQMKAPEMREGVALVQLNEIHDARTRGNPSGQYPDQGRHWQMDGFMESPEHSIWVKITPPNGYNCRASLSPVSWLTAERMGLAVNGQINRDRLNERNASRWKIIEAGEYPDKGFK